MPPGLATRLGEMGEGVLEGRDAQLQWLRRAAAGERGMADALLCRRNIYYPNAKVGRGGIKFSQELGYGKSIGIRYDSGYGNNYVMTYDRSWNPGIRLTRENRYERSRNG